MAQCAYGKPSKSKSRPSKFFYTTHFAAFSHIYGVKFGAATLSPPNEAKIFNPFFSYSVIPFGNIESNYPSASSKGPVGP